MKHKLILASLVAALAPLSSQAADLEISVSNLTGGIYFTPLLVAAHPSAAHLFQTGQAVRRLRTPPVGYLRQPLAHRQR